MYKKQRYDLQIKFINIMMIFKVQSKSGTQGVVTYNK